MKKKYSYDGKFLVTYTYCGPTGWCFSTETVPASDVLTSGEYSDYWITKILKEELETKYKRTVAIINWWYKDDVYF